MILDIDDIKKHIKDDQQKKVFDTIIENYLLIKREQHKNFDYFTIPTGKVYGDIMERWSFGTNNDKLIELVLQGKKTATTSTYNSNELPIIGEQSIITYSNGKDACLVETVDFIILKFKDIDESLSKLEGEGSHNIWKKNHIDFFKKQNKNFNEETTVIFEIFKLVKDIKNTNKC